MSVERGEGGLAGELKAKLAGRVAIVGVGEPSHGDDGAGPLAARMLSEAGVDGVIDSGASPELDTWKIRQLAPDTVLFVDAVDFGGAPGDAALVAPGDLRAAGFDTHRAPIRLTMQYLESEIGARCYLLAIQPEDARYGARMSEAVRRSVESIARMVAEVLR